MAERTLMTVEQCEHRLWDIELARHCVDAEQAQINKEYATLRRRRASCLETLKRAVARQAAEKEKT